MKESEKKTEVAVNVSSGAEKVEKIAEEKKRTKKGDVKKTTVKTEKTAVRREKAESEAAKARVAAALKKKEEKAKRAAEKKAVIEKKAAERKALAEKRAAEKKALVEKRKEEKEERLRRRAHAKANRTQSKRRAANERKQKRESRRQNREKRPSQKGYGGWLAAVVSLGVVTLALATTVTVGAIDMMQTKDGVMAGHRATTYELVGIMEHVDDDLDRARISASPVQQQRILTDLLVQSRLAELDLEKMPVTAEADTNLTSFINRMGRECERMLSKLRNGESLSKKDEKILEELYLTNHEVRMALDEYVAQMSDKDIAEYMKKGAGKFADTIDGLESITMPENRSALPDANKQIEGAGMRRNVGSEQKEGGFEPKIEPSKAEELCLVYFADYPIKEYQCVGESMGHGHFAYNVQGFDDEGTMLFAEVDAMSGELLKFNYYKECNEDNFDLRNAQRIAEEFLEKLGYDDLEAVRVSENGTDGDFTFVYEEDDVIYYPDTVKVKVCRTRGLVTGIDATAFLKNHRERKAPLITVSEESARAKLHEGLTVESSRLAVVKTARGERAAYEFFCSYGEEKYLVYTDAQTGEEISIVNIKNLG